MELDQNEIKGINEWKSKEIDKINFSRLTDDQKKDRIDIVESTQFHRLKPMTVVEVSPHHFEAY